jgi:tRNA (guanine26-N2/guanine27-N2)-dimethyltransferase
VRLEKGAKKADEALSELGFVLHCQKCMHRTTQKGLTARIINICEKCGNKVTVAGPMWLGDFSSKDECDKIIVKVEETTLDWDRRLLRLLTIIRDEIDFPPTFFNVDEITSRLKLPSKSPLVVTERLKEIGFKATLTHFDERGIRTDAGVEDLMFAVKS